MKWYSPYFMFTGVSLMLVRWFFSISSFSVDVFHSMTPLSLSCTCISIDFMSSAGMALASIPASIIWLWLKLLRCTYTLRLLRSSKVRISAGAFFELATLWVKSTSVLALYAPYLSW